MSLSASEIAAVVSELQPLVGSRVEGVRVHAPRALTLELFGGGGSAVTLLVSAEADLTRLHAALHRPPKPPAPFPLQAALRRELDGTRLASLAARPGDRVVEIAFARGGGDAVRLMCELTGRHGNLFVVGADGVIRSSAVRNLSHRRDLVPGRPYVAPRERPEPAPESEFRADPETHARSEASEPEHRAGHTTTEHRRRACKARRGAQGGVCPANAGIVRRSSARVSGPALGFTPLPGARFPLSAAVEARYLALEEERAAAEARRRLREPLRAAHARGRRALEKLAEEAARVPVAEDDRRTADLLKVNLRAIPRGARAAVLTEWTEQGPREVTIALDPAQSARDNMERYYRRYRRIVESASRVAARQVEVQARLSEIGALLAAIETAPVEDLPRMEREARRLGGAPRPAAPPRARRDEPLPPYRTFRSLAGVTLLVGRGAEGNDALTVRVARGNDLWLHARGQAGAHVVARLEKGKAIDGETLLDAAHLAAHFSDARGESLVEVVSTRAKYVRKPKGSAPGAVLYSQERAIAVRMEPCRVERLLESEE